jgi:hypothetical protein
LEAFRVALISAAAVLLAVNLNGQSTTPTWIAGLLPPEAKVIETADVKVGRSADRSLILWMLHPKRVVRQESGGLGCADWVYGDHWHGASRLSLLDMTNKRLINTVEIRGMYEGADEPDHSFPIPFLVPNGSYYVPQVSKNKEGAPIILNLRDLTGEGVAGQFVLFEYEVCTISLTSVLGYSPGSDRAVQYRVETTTESGKPEVTLWVEQVFGAKPIRPGHWDFNWQPGHGADGVVHEQVSFDQAKQVFVRK